LLDIIQFERTIEKSRSSKRENKNSGKMDLDISLNGKLVLYLE
jgi:hypothetical protein